MIITVGMLPEKLPEIIKTNIFITEKRRKPQQVTQEFLFKLKGWPRKINSRVKEEDCDNIQKSKDHVSQSGIHANFTK